MPNYLIGTFTPATDPYALTVEEVLELGAAPLPFGTLERVGVLLAEVVKVVSSPTSLEVRTALVNIGRYVITWASQQPVLAPEPEPSGVIVTGTG